MDKSALLVMDMQTAILSMLPDSSNILKNTNKAIEIAKSNKIPVIYIVLGFRNDFQEVNPNNKAFANLKGRLANSKIEEFTQIHPELAPQKDDLIVIKRRVSAFTGSDLEVVLKSLGINHLLLAGVATGGVVLSTIREAADKDYILTVLSDCCTDSDDEIHQTLINKVFPRQANVINVVEWLEVK